MVRYLFTGSSLINLYRDGVFWINRTILYVVNISTVEHLTRESIVIPHKNGFGIYFRNDCFVAIHWDMRIMMVCPTG
jgi:hypothetical protein